MYTYDNNNVRAQVMFARSFVLKTKRLDLSNIIVYAYVVS